MSVNLKKGTSSNSIMDNFENGNPVKISHKFHVP